MLKGKHVVLGISGGIAVYKCCELTRLLEKAGAEVRVVMTANAARFVAPLTFETLTHNRVSTDTFEHTWEIEHISLARFADMLVIAPATADIIAKLRTGIADDLLSTTFLAMNCPVLIAPAMNTNMWYNAATQENVKVLAERGCAFVGPDSGELACGDKNTGRMSEPEEIFDKIRQMLETEKDLAGKKVLVTAGPTREMLDPVRFLTNRSTGRMGYAICEAARERGAEVHLVTGPVDIKVPDGIEVTHVTSTQDMYNAVTSLAEQSDVVIQAAAPADFTPEHVAEQKIKKHGDNLTLTLVPTPDIAKAIGTKKHKGQVLVAFAAETENTLENAQAKRVKKNADFIVLNDVTRPGAGFGTETNIVTIIGENGAEEYPLMSKREVADRILDCVRKVL